MRIKQEVAQVSGNNCTILGATKGVAKEVVDFVLDNNLLDVVGENRAQEFRDKYHERHFGKMHFIGRLQTNKIKYLQNTGALIHGLDSLELAKEIEKRGGANCLVQVNVGKELAKGGVFLENAIKFVKLVEKNCPQVQIKGVMAVLPVAESDTLKVLYTELDAWFLGFKKVFPDKTILSAGMSEDWRFAIEYAGANIIRPGSVLFGGRTYT